MKGPAKPKQNVAKVNVKAAPRKGKQTQSMRRELRKASREAEMKEMQEIRKRLAEPIPESLTKFSELPISSKTVAGLTAAHFVVMTEVQKATLPLALAGKDVLGAAKTGSGKTLAFLIPILERLNAQGWTGQDGLGALVLSPTRELAVQTFEVLKRIGVKHGFSAGLIIGGKDVRAERELIGRMNILIATPGRLLQHMDQAVDFDWSQLQILVLDEADRILDLGFARTLDAIIDALPASRQSLLFSATQSDDISALARLSLKTPSSVSLDEAKVTPEALKQTFLVCPLEEKLDRLFSFMKANLNAKIIVFLSSCKQVRFVYESFCTLQPGIPLACLHGKQKQFNRLNIFTDFCKKKAAVLFATDIAARGLDFPAVDWVLQLDCPEDVPTYIHRVGRTARYNAAGNALLFLLPSEAPAMLEALQETHNIPIKPHYPKGDSSKEQRALLPPKYLLQGKLQALCSSNPEIRYLGQKALISYVRSIHLHSDKSVFKVDDLPLDAYASALGLPGTPKLRFVAKSNEKNANRQLQKMMQEDKCEEEEEPSDQQSGAEEAAPKRLVAKSAAKSVERMFGRKNADVLSEHFAKLRETTQQEEEDAEEDFLSIKRRDHDLEGIPEPRGPSTRVSRRDRLLTLKKTALKTAPEPHRIVFDDDDLAHQVLPYDPEDAFDKAKSKEMIENFVSSEKHVLKQADSLDAQRVKELRRQARMEKKRKLRDRATDSGSKMARLDNSDSQSDA